MIDPISAAGASGFLQGITAQMAGMSASDAYDEFITQNYDSDEITIGYGVITTDKPSISGETSSTIVDSTEPIAVDAFNDYVENERGEVSEITGGALDGSTVKTGAFSILTPAQGNDLQAVMPVGVPLDAAIVAANKALGVSVNAAELDVDIKRQFANSIVSGTGMIYDKARDLVLAWKDSLGRILFPKSVLDGINEVLQENAIGGAVGKYGPETVGGVSVSGGGALGAGSVPGYTWEMHVFECETGVAFTGSSAFYRWIMASANPNSTGRYIIQSFSKGRWEGPESWSEGSPVGAPQITHYTLTSEYTYNDKTVYYASSTLSLAGYKKDYGMVYSDISGGIAQIAWTMIYGVTEGGYPDGTSRSEAPYYTPATIPSAGSVMADKTNSIPVVPINIPDDPYNSTDSTEDPTAPTSTDNVGVLNPGISGSIPDTSDPDNTKEGTVPIPLPIPDTKPSNPAVPLVNPSVIDSTLIAELVEELANTIDPQPGQSSGIIPVPPLPGITDPDTGQTTFPSIIPDSGPGFIHVYNPTPAEFVAFGSWLWVTYADATIDKILNNPFDGVIGAHELYATPNRGGRDNIRSAFLVCPTTADLVPNRYSEIDCGTVIVPEFYGNYLDYSPYSQAYIYLPFIGINEVSIDDIVGHAVNIRYRVDSYSGSCIAMIFVAKEGYQNLCYQFAGSCSVEVPMAGGSQAAIKAGMMQAEAYARAQVASAAISAASQIGGGIASGTVPGIVMGALGGLGTAAAGMYGANQSVEAARVANKSSVQHSGQFGASHGAMGQKIPFIIIRNPIQVKVVNYNDDYGYPAHKRVIIGGCTGYLRVREVNVISAHATDDEKAAIEVLLKNGVYVS